MPPLDCMAEAGQSLCTGLGRHVGVAAHEAGGGPRGTSWACSLQEARRRDHAFRVFGLRHAALLWTCSVSSCVPGKVVPSPCEWEWARARVMRLWNSAFERFHVLPNMWSRHLALSSVPAWRRVSSHRRLLNRGLRFEGVGCAIAPATSRRSIDCSSSKRQRCRRRLPRTAKCINGRRPR